MASKIFMGDMPELLGNILNNLNEDTRSLYSCVLVSHFWSKISVPILWKDPFLLSRNSSFISRYFSSLNEHDSFILNRCGIIIDFPNTLFHYAKFLKILDLSSLSYLVGNWIEDLNINLKKDVKLVKYDVANLLFKLFIERGASLSKFDLNMSDDVDMGDEAFDIKPEIFYLLGRNECFFSQIKRLSVCIKIDPCPQSAITLLRILDENSKKINSLKLGRIEEDDELIHTLACIIKSQEQLKRLKLLCSVGYIISALKSQQNSLRELIMDSCYFSIADFNKIKNFKNLEVIRIYHGRDTDVLLNILDFNDHKIKTLVLCAYSINAANILQLVQRSGTLLQRLTLSSEQKEIYSLPLLLEKLKNFCPNITFLNFSRIKLSAQFLNLIGCLQNLQFLSLKWIDNESEEEETKTSVIKFANILPLSLHYLNLHKSPHIDDFLDHCNAPLKSLLLEIKYGDEKLTNALIGFCVRKKTLDKMYIYDLFKHDDTWDKFKKDLEEYVELVPLEHIYVSY
ncbi:hypothetical protein F8M41_000791 [Gigaspora margarita]|uniref:F-box domain-containing protein n=1 Tax=Gigaspora margarita TaxID=4874 RepID=A0A8H4A9K9_GIGMA|nr:hypothetical protein F8M41_000791 [Gigaspora margarita]